MTINCQTETANTVTVTVSGRVNHQEIFRFLDKNLQNQQTQTVNSVLVLCAEDLEVKLAREAAIIIADKLSLQLSNCRTKMLAFVCQQDYIFGLCRQLGMRIEKKSLQVDVFRTEKEARHWLWQNRVINSVYALPENIKVVDHA